MADCVAVAGVEAICLWGFACYYAFQQMGFFEDFGVGWGVVVVLEDLGFLFFSIFFSFFFFLILFGR